MQRWVSALVLVFVLAAFGPALGFAEEGRTDDTVFQRDLENRVRRGAPLTIYVVVALCHDAQVDCGGNGLGNPGNLQTNLYWGALFGARRILDRPDSGFLALEQTSTVDGVLARAVYRREVDGAPWGVDRGVEQLVVLDAVHGNAIDSAVARFHHVATHGAKIAIDHAGEKRILGVDLAGYVGHNRLMDGLRLPVVVAQERAPVPSFVLACLSDRYFSAPLREAGSLPLVMTRSYMAPEGYLVAALARAFGDHLPPAEVRQAVVDAYARWQKISPRIAATVFVP